MFSVRKQGGILAFYWRTVVRRHLASALLISLLMLFGALFEMATIGSAVPILDAIIQGGSGSSSRVLRIAERVLVSVGSVPDRRVVVLSLLLLANVLFLVHSGFVVLTQYVTARMGLNLRRDTKCALFDRFIHAPYEEIAQRGRGTILNTVEALAERIDTAIWQLGTLFTAICNATVLLLLMFYLSWWATLIIGLLTVCGVLGIRKMTDSQAREAGNLIHATRADEVRLSIDAVDGIKVVKAHVLESDMMTRLEKLLFREMQPALRLALFRGFPGFLNEFAAATVVLILAGATFMFPALGMTFPVLVAFLLAIRRCSPAVANINLSFVELATLRRDVEAIEEVLHTMPKEPSGTQTCGHISEIRMSDVSFAYPTRSAKNVLDGINVIMRRGTVTALVGATGSGKSTMASLLLGLYRPLSGHILVEGIDLNALDLRGWRKKIGYVPQDVFLFNASIKDNIALWDESISDAEVERAARLADIHDFVISLPDGYSTIVGDRGLRLSGGQCQRVAIARAVVRHPDVLIFDEATSALDNLTERAVYESIRAFRADTIVIAIAHRLSTVRDADQIVVLDGGRIVEIGTHDSLLQHRGIYVTLYETEASAARG